MNIPLNQFEQIIDEVILKRGLDYFKKGLVEEPEELSPGCFEAMVQGSEPYRVTVTIHNENVTDYSCTCPYDMGPVCKHVASLLFALQKEALGITVRAKKSSTDLTGKPEKTSGRKTVKEQVDEILGKLPPETLCEFIREQSLGDPAFRRRFLARFTHTVKGESKAIYAQQVKAILQSAKGRGGFIEWNRAPSVGKAVYEMLVNAGKHIEIKNYQTALLISSAVLEEMVKALQFADDSDGEIGGCIEEAMEIMARVAMANPPEELRKWMFEYSVKAFKKKLFEGWDWHLDILLLATEVMHGAQEADILLDLLESMPHSQYEEDRIHERILDVLQKSGRHDEAEAYLASHIENPSIREQAIKRAFELGDMQLAGNLAREGITQDQKNKPGLADSWVDWLLKIALKQKDKEAVITHARHLLYQANRDHKQYYKILKSEVDAGEWTSFIDGLIQEITTKGRWSDSRLLAWLCIEEERWKTLLDVVSRNFTLTGIREYESHLCGRYPEEFAALYKKGILELLERHTGRNHYQEAARFIRRMRKFGAITQAEDLVKHLQQKFPQRRALLEELERV